MSHKVDCLDNSVIENLFWILKSKLLYLKKFELMEQFKQELVDYIYYYNNIRFEIKLKGLSPALYMRQALMAS